LFGRTAYAEQSTISETVNATTTVNIQEMEEVVKQERPTKSLYVSAVVTKYQKQISGQLLDRIDIHIEVPRVDYEKLSGD